MSNPRFRYQTLAVPNRLPFTGGPSARGNAVAAGVKLFHRGMVALNRGALAYRINREIENMAPRIERAMMNYEEHFRQSRPGVGVLVVVGIQEWKHPDPTGTRGQSFLSIHLGGTGENPQAVLTKYRSEDRLVQGPPRGWRRRNVYIWVTRE